MDRLKAMGLSIARLVLTDSRSAESMALVPSATGVTAIGGLRWWHIEK